jgi:biopolymer transport protein ExbD
MSHGGASDSALEPNLTPLLDLILQILMFFMVTINLNKEQKNADVALPFSQSALPLDARTEEDPLFVNLLIREDRNDRDEPTTVHEVKVVGQKAMDLAAARNWIKKQHEDRARYGEVKNPVIIRAHTLAEYAKVFELLQACSDAGFRKLKVRAIIP